MSQHPPINGWRFDAVVAGPEKIWDLPAIAACLGVSVDTARRLAKKEGVPIYRPGGRYFALRSELLRWLQSK